MTLGAFQNCESRVHGLSPLTVVSIDDMIGIWQIYIFYVRSWVYFYYENEPLQGKITLRHTLVNMLFIAER